MRTSEGWTHRFVLNGKYRHRLSTVTLTNPIRFLSSTLYRVDVDLIQMVDAFCDDSCTDYNLSS